MMCTRHISFAAFLHKCCTTHSCFVWVVVYLYIYYLLFCFHCICCTATMQMCVSNNASLDTFAMNGPYFHSRLAICIYQFVLIGSLIYFVWRFVQFCCYLVYVFLMNAFIWSWPIGIWLDDDHSVVQRRRRVRFYSSSTSILYFHLWEMSVNVLNKRSAHTQFLHRSSFFFYVHCLHWIFSFFLSFFFFC